jgi:hypothetical protein
VVADICRAAALSTIATHICTGTSVGSRLFHGETVACVATVRPARGAIAESIQAHLAESVMEAQHAAIHLVARQVYGEVPRVAGALHVEAVAVVDRAAADIVRIETSCA